MKLISLTMLCFLSGNAFGHGLKSATANIEVRPNNLIELKVQFDLNKLLNHNSNQYSTMTLAALSEEKFAFLYNEIIKLFDNHLQVNNAGKSITINKRYPTQQQMFQVIKRQFIKSKFTAKQAAEPYTFSDRRYYQVFYFDFKLSAKEDLAALSISFPSELGNIYITFSESTNYEIHSGKMWQLNR